MAKKMETICHRIQLKPDSLDTVYEWAKELMSRKNEALATLRDEGVWIESVFLERTEQGDFLIYYMKLESMDRAKEVVAKSKHAIDEYHQKFKKATWVTGKKLELLVDFDRFEEEESSF